MLEDSLKNFQGGSMNQDDALEYIAKNDWIELYNGRATGTSAQESGYITNIESTVPVSLAAPAGINKGIGAVAFESIRAAVGARYNSAGNHQFIYYDYDANTATVIYTDKINSNGISLLNFNSSNYITFKLINDTYLVWTDGISPIGFTNLISLKNGLYGTVKAEDFSLIKPQNLIPIKASYASDNGKAANFLKGKLWQFTSRYHGIEDTDSAYATWSKRIIPLSESTPNVGTSVRENNCIILTVDMGSDRVKTVDIAGRSGNLLFGIIKSVDRAYALALPNTAVSINTNVYEAYDPATNLYSFVFYNDTVVVPVAPVETDLAYDHVPLLAEAVENVNNNIIAVGGITEGYARPNTQVSLSVVGYNPNISVPTSGEPNPIHVSSTYSSGAGSGLGNHVRLLRVDYQGVPHTGDVLKVVLYDVRNASATKTFTYTVPSAFDGNLAAVVQTFAVQFQAPGVSQRDGGATWRIEFRDDPYYEIQSATISLFSTGASVSRSIHALLDNSSYTLALSYRDKYGRFFPLDTNNNFIVKTPSYAQLLGQTPAINWTILSPNAPVGAVDYQWLITKNATANNIIDILGNVLTYKGGWDAHINDPELAVNLGTVGDTYQITGPSQANDHRNLGNGEIPFNTGDYVVYNGNTWDLISKSFGDLTDTSNIMVFKINPLLLFNQKYGANGISTVLKYDYAEGDRATLHYYVDGSPVYINNPCVDVQVLGYDAGAVLVKMEKSSDVNLTTLSGKDVLLRLYSPKQADQTTSAEQNATIEYEIGERFTITNGLHDVLTGTITDGDIYYKTRSYQSAVNPNITEQVLVNDFNFSDFYPSAFTSYGRPRTYTDELERSQKKASIRFGENFILGSKKNGLTRFYAENIYGEADGETSSNYGLIGILHQRNEYLIVIQELKVGYIPLNISIIEDQVEQQQVAISEKLFNKIRYSESGDIGIGRAKESFAYFNNNLYFVDPNRSEPIRVGLDGVKAISGKMSKFFKKTLQSVYAQGKKIVGYYDTFYNEYVIAIQTDGGVLTLIPFSSLNWNIYDPYTIVPTDVTAVNDSTNATHSYDATTGKVTYTPANNFVGNNVATFTFNFNGQSYTKNNCLNWTAGTTTVNPFVFQSLTGQPLNTQVSSNSILVTGNNIAVPISISSGQYSVNGGAFTSAPGLVNPYDTVQVRQTTSNTGNTTTTVTLTISGTTGDFSVTTLQQVNIAYTVSETTGDAYADANLIITVNGTDQPAVTMSTSGTLTVNVGDVIGLRAYAQNGAVGANPKLRLLTVKSGTTLYDSGNLAATPPPDFVITEPNFTTASSDSFNVSAIASADDVHPDAFAFTNLTNQQKNVYIQSNSQTITGVTVPVAVSVTAGQYRINGGTWTSAAGTISNGQTLELRNTSSNIDYTAVSMTLNVGDRSATWSVTTGSTTVTLFAFAQVNEANLSTDYTSNTYTVAGNTLPVPISIRSGYPGSYNINGGAFTTSAGTVNAGDVVSVKLTSNNTPNTTTTTILDIDGQSGSFVVNTYHTITVRIHISEQANPYSDGNGVFFLNGTAYPGSRVTGSGDYVFNNVQSRLPLTFRAFSEAPSTSATATKTLEVKLNGTDITGAGTNPQTNGNQTGSESPLDLNTTGVDNGIYDMYVTTAATGSASFVAQNNGFANIGYSIYPTTDGTGTPTSTGVLSQKAVYTDPPPQLQLDTLITGGANSSIVFRVITAGSYSTYEIPGSAPYVSKSAGDILYQINQAQIASKMGMGVAGMSMAYGT